MNKPKTSGEHGTARLLTGNDLASIGMGKTEDGPLLGDVGWRKDVNERGYQYVDTKWLRYEGDAHLTTIAKTGAGKGRRVIWGNLKTMRNSILVVDPKGEGVSKSCKLRESWGQDCYVIDPFHEVPDEYLPRTGRASFNPIDLVRDSGSKAFDVALLIAESLITPSEKEPYWGKQAQALLAALILFAAFDATFDDSERNFRFLWDVARHPDHHVTTLIAMRLSTNAFVAEVAGMFLVEGMDEAGNRTFSKDDSKEARGIERSMIDGCMRLMYSTEIMSCLDRTTLDFGALRDGNMTVYLVLPFDHLETHGGFLRMLISCAMHQITARGIEPHPRRPPVYMMIDEFVALGRMDRIKRAVREMRGYNLKLHLFIQDLTALKDVYPDGWGSFLGSSGAIQYFGGSSDNFTNEYLSKLTGQETILSPSWNETISHSNNDGWSTSGPRNAMGESGGTSSGWTFSETTSTIGRPLKTPDEIGNLDPSRQLIVFSGVGCLIAGLPDDLIHFQPLTDAQLKARAASSYRAYNCRTPGCKGLAVTAACMVVHGQHLLVKCNKCGGGIDSELENVASWAAATGTNPATAFNAMQWGVVNDHGKKWAEVPPWHDAWMRMIDPYGLWARYPMIFSGRPQPPVVPIRKKQGLLKTILIGDWSD